MIFRVRRAFFVHFRFHFRFAGRVFTLFSSFISLSRDLIAVTKKNNFFFELGQRSEKSSKGTEMTHRMNHWSPWERNHFYDL